MDPLLRSDRPRALGRTDILVSPLAWGTWRLGPDPVAPLLAAALDQGITLVDTADIYGYRDGAGFGAAEARLGEAFAADPGLRGRIVLATKGGIRPPVPYDSSADHLIAACEASLKRLRTDHVDLYQVHRPDHLAHPAEVAEALTRLRSDGKIRAAGVSNYRAAATAALQSFLDFPLASHQPEFSPLTIEPLEDGVLDQAMERRMSVLAWSPLAGGRLGGEGSDERSRAVIAALDTIAARAGIPRAAAAYAWIMAHPSRPIPIIGSQRPERIREATKTRGVNLTRAEWYAVLVAARGAPVP